MSPERNLLAACLLVACTVAPRAALADSDDQDHDSTELAERARQLSLTPKQQETLRTIRDNLKKAEVQAKAQIELVQIDLRRELDRPKPSRKKVGIYVDRISRLEATIRKARLYASLSIRDMLSKPQWAQLQTMRSHGRHGHGVRYNHVYRNLRRQIERAKREARREAKRARREAERVKREVQREMVRARREADKTRKRARRDALRNKPGTLMLQSQPAGASVYIDGKLLGKTPLRATLRPGLHTLRLEHKGYRPKTLKTHIRPNQASSVSISLAK